MKRILTVVTIITIISSFLSGCYDRREVDDMTYVIAIGLDKGLTNKLMLTLQYAIPLNISGGGGGGGSGGGGSSDGASKSVSMLTLDCPTLIAGLNMANNFIGKEINLAHAKLVVFSEELAKSGDIFGYINGMLRNKQFRPNMYIVVSRGPARDYIDSIKPVQEADPSKFYELKFQSYKYTGFTANTNLFKFQNYIKSYTQQPTAILVGVSNNKTVEDFFNDETTAKNKGHAFPFEGDYKAGDLPKIGDVKGEAMGLAAFNESKMVGELDGAEATYYLMASGEYNHSYWTIPDPLNSRWNIITNVFQRRKPEVRVDFADGKPRINLKIKLEGDFLAIQSGINYEESSKREIFEKAMEDQIKEGVQRFLDKTAKEFRADICGFGRFAKKKFLTWDEWEKFDWLNRYKDATFTLDVDFKIRRPGLLVRTSILTDMGKAGE